MSSIYDNYPAVRYVDEYDKDTDEQCVRCKGNCGFIGITGMWACKGFVPMTNADRIRGMSDKKLAFYIVNHPMWSDEKACLDWLKSPVEVDE